MPGLKRHSAARHCSMVLISYLVWPELIISISMMLRRPNNNFPIVLLYIRLDISGSTGTLYHLTFLDAPSTATLLKMRIKNQFLSSLANLRSLCTIYDIATFPGLYIKVAIGEFSHGVLCGSVGSSLEPTQTPRGPFGVTNWHIKVSNKKKYTEVNLQQEFFLCEDQICVM